VSDERPASLLAARIGLYLGPLIFLAIVLSPAPGALSLAGWRTAAVMALMMVWWITEAVPIPVTSLLPLALFPLLGVLDMGQAAAPYANELIFLFMGGFFIAAAMERTGLHRRIALGIVSRVGTSPSRLVLGFMLATAFLSMWISNTATAAMMLPVALAVAAMLKPPVETGDPYPFGIGLMLGIAYAASIGGVATLIGTPPNAIMAGAVRQFLGVQLGFGQWMLVGVPLVALLLPAAWLLLTRVLYPPGELSGDVAGIIAAERAGLGRMGRGERVVAVVFALAAIAWMMREPKDLGWIRIPGIASFAPGVKDSTIAIAASLVLFATPLDLKRHQFLLDWASASRISWGVLLLFGGGLSMALAMDESGLATWIGSGVAALESAPYWVLLLAVTTLIVFLTEVTSNAATATMAMPLMAGAGAALQQPALPLMVAAGVAASMAYMLPVATPPNAIVFSSGYLTIPQMARAGWWLNLISIVIITAAAVWLVPAVLM
jgi:sodium-dependent dicarboxylate transporter 2/3/5